MKRLVRIENILLLIPVLLTAIYLYTLVWKTGFVDNYFDRAKIKTVIAVEVYSQLLQWFLIILPAYLIHYFLRIIGRRNNVLAVIHVTVTALSLLYWGLAADFATSVVPGWHTTIYPPKWGVGMGIYFFAQLFFLLFQIAFIIYGFVLIGRWKRTRPPNTFR